MGFGYSTDGRPWAPHVEGEPFGTVGDVRVLDPPAAVGPIGTTLPGDPTLRQNPFCRLLVAPSHQKPYIPSGERFAFLNFLTGFIQAKAREGDIYNLYHWPAPLDCWSTTPRMVHSNTKMVYSMPGENVWTYDFAEGDPNLPTVEMRDIYGSYPQLMGKWRTIIPDGNPRCNMVEMPDSEYEKPWAIETHTWPWGSEATPGHLPARESFAVTMYHYAPPRLRVPIVEADAEVEWGGENPADEDYPGGWGEYAEPGTAGLVFQKQAYASIMWGAAWRLIFTQATETTKESNGATVYLTATNPFTQVYLLRYLDGKWVKVDAWKLTRDDLGRHNGVDYEFMVKVAHVGGWIAIGFNDGDWHMIDPNHRVTFEGTDGEIHERPLGTLIPPEEGGVPGHALYRFDTPAQSVCVSGRNMPLYCGVHHIDFAKVANAGMMMRNPAPLGVAPIPRSWGYLPVRGGSTDLQLQAVAGTDELYLSMNIYYDEETGESPTIHGMSAHWEPEWAEPAASDDLDFGNAVVEAHLSVRQPRDVAVTRLSVELDRQVLEDMSAAAGIDWKDYIQQWSPVQWWEGWHEDEPGNPNPTGHKRVEGIIRDIRRGSLGFQRDNVVLEIWDWATATMTDPAGKIDASYGPLDWAPEAREAHLNGELYYGWQGIKTILQRATGLGRLLRALPPPSHYSLVFGYYFRRGQMPNASDNMPLWTPPWGSYAMDWVRQIAQYDGMVFFNRGKYFYYVDLEQFFHGTVPAGWPQPQTHHCYDWVYIGGGRDEARIENAIEEIQVEKRANESIVSVDVWGMMPGSQLYGIGVKCLDVEAMAPDIGGWTKPDNYTGLETGLMLAGREYATKDICTAVCRKVFSMFSGREPFRARVKMQGQPTWWWGDEVVLHGSQAGQDLKRVRIRELDSTFHKISGSERLYTTSIVGATDPSGG